MDKSQTLRQYISQKSAEYFLAVTNIFLFLPYFFSVRLLLKTLFSPWKKLTVSKTSPGFSFHEWSSRISFNLISSMIGAMMRLSIIFTYLFIQVSFIIFLPAITLVYFCFLPFLYLFEKSTQSYAEKIEAQKKTFIQTHTLQPQNTTHVQDWFAIYKDMYLRKVKWWTMENLGSTPPLARDWSAGFTPTLDQYSIELTTAKPHYDKLVDRQKEIAQIEQILSRNQERNVIIAGENGIGKHTIVEALAKKIFEGKSTPLLVYKRLLKLDMSSVINSHNDYAQREKTLDTILYEAATASNVILLIDDIEKYVNNQQNETDFSSTFAKYAKTSKIQIIGITTPFLYEKFIRTNERIHILFDKVDVFEITKEEAMQILLTHAFSVETRYKIIITYESIVEIIERCQYYITDIPFPEKALDLLDEACSWATQRNYKRLDPEHIQTILAQKTHIPMNLDDNTRNRLINLEHELTHEIIDQDKSVKQLASILKKAYVMGGKRTKPMASMLLLGPTGVGKTQTAKTLNKLLFSNNEEIIRVDMAFYQKTEDIEKLIGGSVTKDPGILTEQVREKPYGVLLLDEFEKANQKLLDIFLTVLDEGYFVDGHGKRVDCRSLIVIATSNAGADFIYKKLEQGKILDQEAFSKELIDYLVENKIFTPELLNRFDGVVVYKPISERAISEITEQKIKLISDELARTHKIMLSVNPEFAKKLAAEGFAPQFGARNLERVIREQLEAKIANMILENKVKEGDTITIS